MPLIGGVMAKQHGGVETVRMHEAACYPPPMTLTGLLGGSFNPAHGGHRALSLGAIERLGLDEMWWLVSPGNPLKGAPGMASLAARFASARRAARRAPIRVTAIETELGTRYTVDTLAALIRRFPDRRFVWLMGADNLAQFHRWRDWRRIAGMVPIAVVARPGYDGQAQKAPAMGWLRRFVRPAVEVRNRTCWRLPSLVLLDLPPDPTSATAIRAADPDWHESVNETFQYQGLRDGVTRRKLAEPRKQRR
jgi:nicotinate-nucleotide adenylyltransferase